MGEAEREGKAELELKGALRGKHPPSPVPSAPPQQRPHHDGAGAVDQVASRLGRRIDRVNGTQEQLLLKVSTAQDVLLILSQGETDARMSRFQKDSLRRRGELLTAQCAPPPPLPAPEGPADLSAVPTPTLGLTSQLLTLLVFTAGSLEMTPVPLQGASKRTRSKPPTTWEKRVG